MDRVVKGAGSYLTHAAQEVVVAIGEFDQGDVAGESEEFLYQIE